jgi:glycosyltransferase involved in cell wall biosynthesis
VHVACALYGSPTHGWMVSMRMLMRSDLRPLFTKVITMSAQRGALSVGADSPHGAVVQAIHGRRGMNVLVWVSSVTLAGGLERVGLSLANGLSRCGMAVVLVGPYCNNPDLIKQIEPSVTYVEHVPKRSVGGLLETCTVLRRVVREHNIDVVSAHGSVFPLLPLRTPVVWTEHGLRYGRRPMFAGPEAALWALVHRRLQHRKWHFVAVSHFVLRAIRKQLFLDDTVGTVVYNGVPPASSLRSLRPPRLQPPYQLGYVGRLEPEKRVCDLFQIDERLRELDVPCHWHIFGAGSLEDSIRDRANASERATVHGVADAVDAFAAIDLLCVPSYMEGLPTVLLEAQLARRLVAAWNYTGIPEAAGENTVLISPPFLLTRMADAIAATLRRGQAPPPAPAGSWEVSTMVSNYQNLLTQVITAPNAQATA